MEFYNKTVGDYPYKQYSVIIQGGDGGMEYAMCTLILGQGLKVYLVLYTMAHSWFQHVLASNESHHGWMDEVIFLRRFRNEQAKKVENPFWWLHRIFSMVNSGKELPQGTHADRLTKIECTALFIVRRTFLDPIDVFDWEENLMNFEKKYYSDFKFKHPTPNDIKELLKSFWC
jgi:hypothetical protein